MVPLEDAAKSSKYPCLPAMEIPLIFVVVFLATAMVVRAEELGLIESSQRTAKSTGVSPLSAHSSM